MLDKEIIGGNNLDTINEQIEEFIQSLYIKWPFKKK
jgi:hypothetical protein